MRIAQIIKAPTVVLLATGLSGCGAAFDRLNPTAVSPRGLSPSVESLNFAQVSSSQDKLIDSLKSIAQLQGVALAATDPKWNLVMKAGLGLIGEQCNEYMDSLFKFDKDHRALRSGLTATGAAAATIMGLTATPAAPIAATAAVFGLATSYFDADVNSVVFEIGPAAVRNIVVQAQGSYLTSVTANPGNYTDRPSVILALQGYLQICTPVAIESAVEQASATTTFETKPGQQQNPSPTQQQTSLAPASGQSVNTAPLARTTTKTQILAWYAPRGTLNMAHVAALNGWMTTETVDPLIKGAPFVFLLSAGGGPGQPSAQQMEIDREQAITDLKIPKE